MRWLGILAILVCLPAKLHINPFSLPNAEQEIYAGPMTEYAGPELAMWELSHGLEWVAATGLVATLVAPHITAGGSPPLHLRRALVRHRAAALGARRRHRAPRHRLQRALLLAVHAHLRGSCHFLRALHEVPVMNILTMLWKNLGAATRPCSSPRGPKSLRASAAWSSSIPPLHRLRGLPLSLHLARHRVQGRQRRIHLELQPRPVHLLRPLR
jgi:hypothetical protein